MDEAGRLDSVTFMTKHLQPGDLHAAVKCALLELNIPTDAKGYRCLAAAIPLYYADPEQSLTKEIYPEVGKCSGQGTSGGRVEKQIRDAIAKAWEKRDTKVWDRYFSKGQKPTNGAFISRITELLRLWEDCIQESAKAE